MKFLLNGAQQLGLELSQNMLNQFEIYEKMLLKWNEKMNLTAIINPKEIAIKHFLDSLVLTKYLNFKPSTRLIDIGTGAGFPGVPLKIFHPELNLTLLDSLQKRLTFLTALLSELNLSADLIHARAEEGGKQVKLRECFNFAVARSVASLSVLAEYCLPYVKPGGAFIAMKGPNPEEEITAAEPLIKILGATVEITYKLTLPNDLQRSIILIRKIKPTPQGYPRRSAKIKRKDEYEAAKFENASIKL